MKLYTYIKVKGSYENTKIVGNIGDSDKIIDIFNSNFITISNLNLADLKAENEKQTPTGINVRGKSKFIKIKNNLIHHIETDYKKGNSHGIATYGKGISHIKIENNKLYSLKLGNSEALVLNGNVKNFKIKNNKVFNNNNIGIDIIGFEGIENNEKFDKVRNGLISNNIVRNNTSKNNPSYGGEQSAAGIYIDGSEKIKVLNNKTISNDIGIEIASEHQFKSANNILVMKNIIKNNGYTGIAVGGYNKSMGGVEKLKLNNNKFYHNDRENLFGGEILLQYNIKGLIINKNSINPVKNGYIIIKDNNSGENIRIKQNKYNPYNANKVVWDKKDGYFSKLNRNQ